MEIKEYLETYNKIIQKHRNDKIILDETFRNNIQELDNLFSKDYVEKLSRFQIGDFVKYYITIKIEKIEARVIFGKPSIYYYGYKHVFDEKGEVVKSKNSRMYCFEDSQNLVKVNILK